MIGSEIRIGTDNCKIEGSATNMSFVDAMLENHNNMLQQLPIYFSTLDWLLSNYYAFDWGARHALPAKRRLLMNN